MVSLWPWKADTSSPASFEKALSKLSTQITSANLSLETTRSRARRITALWTLYTTLAYLLYTLIIALVLGPQQWAPPHYAGLAGAPVLIYAVRKGITMIFDWRTAQQQSHVTALQKQRDSKISDLKKATRYDSTQELLQKYSGKPAPSKLQQQSQQGTKRKILPSHEQQRTGIAPPATANIPRRNTASTPSTPPWPNVNTSSPISARTGSLLSAGTLMDSPTHGSPESPGFAPNAFLNAPPSQARPAYEQQPKWYDRILDVMLGEDETLAKNRIILICSSCRLVNGQAPPGVKTVEEMGRWKCGGCQAWNGIENEAAKAVKEMRETGRADERHGWERVSKGRADEGGRPQYVDGTSKANKDPTHDADDVTRAANEISDSENDLDEEDTSDGEDEAEEDIDTRARRVTRSATKQTGKGKK